jgi:hypothetical protein
MQVTKRQAVRFGSRQYRQAPTILKRSLPERWWGFPACQTLVLVMWSRRNRSASEARLFVGWSYQGVSVAPGNSQKVSEVRCKVLFGSPKTQNARIAQRFVNSRKLIKFSAACRFRCQRPISVAFPQMGLLKQQSLPRQGKNVFRSLLEKSWLPSIVGAVGGSATTSRDERGETAY